MISESKPTMKVKQRSRIPLPVFNQKRKDTEGDPNQTTTLPTISTTPVQLSTSIRKKIAKKSIMRGLQQESTPESISITPGQLSSTTRRKIGSKLSMGDLQQERVNLVMKREELSKEWLDNEREKRQLEVKLFDINRNMRTVEKQIEETTKRESELRSEVERRTELEDKSGNRKGFRKNEQLFQPKPQQPQQGYKLPIIYNQRSALSTTTTNQMTPQPPQYQKPTYSRRLRQAVESSRNSPISLPKIVDKTQQHTAKKDTPASTSSGRPSAPFNPGRRTVDGSWN